MKVHTIARFFMNFVSAPWTAPNTCLYSFSNYPQLMSQIVTVLDNFRYKCIHTDKKIVILNNSKVTVE